MSTERKKVAVVTGASSGIGYALVDELASRGFMVYAAARRTAPMKALVDKHGSSLVQPVHLDVTDEDQIVKFRARLTKELPEPKLDILFNNAGLSCSVPAVDVSSEKIQSCFNVNVVGPINITRELSPLIINAKGVIVFTGSLAGILPFPFGSVYGASKAAIHQYASILHLEMKPFGVKVLNAITGSVRTDIADKDALPETSIFNVPEGRAAFEERRLIALKNHPIEPAVYAKKLVDDALSKRDQVNVYRGSLATLASWAAYLAPTWMIEKYCTYKFKLGPAYAAIIKKMAASQSNTALEESTGIQPTAEPAEPAAAAATTATTAESAAPTAEPAAETAGSAAPIAEPITKPQTN